MSGQRRGIEVDVSGVNGAFRDGDGGIPHGARLLAFADAAMADDDAALAREREVLRKCLSDAAFVDTCATIGAFNVVDRIADATGIPLDDMMLALSGEIREELDLSRFGSAANTPGVRRS